MEAIRFLINRAITKAQEGSLSRQEYLGITDALESAFSDYKRRLVHDFGYRGQEAEAAVRGFLKRLQSIKFSEAAR